MDGYGYFPDFYSPEEDFSGGYLPASGRPQAPKRLTLEELLAKLSPPPAARPKQATLRDLTGDDRRQAQQAGLWQGLAALGANISGRQGEAAAGIGRIQAAQQGVVDQVNARQQQAYQDQAEQNAATIADEQQRAKIGSLYGVYQKIAAAEPPSSPFVADAEAAAKMGDMSKLQDQLAQVPQRAEARKQGLDPDAWATNQRLQQQLKDELAHQAAVSARPDRVADQDALIPGEEDKARRLGAIALANQKAEKLAPGWQAPLQLEPLSYVAAAATARAEAEAAVRDAHAKSQQLTPRLGVSQGRWGLITPDPLTGKVTFKEADGQPQKQGKYHYVTIDGVPYAQDTEHPEQGAFPVKLHSAKETAPWAGGQTPTPAPRPAPAPARTPAAAVPPPPASPQATAKLSAIKDPATSAKIQKARAAGYSDSEIAAFLGIH